MQAVHWLRLRQEKQELIYWLSLVYYNPEDHSPGNRIYLVYLILFFSVWIFLVLIFFVSAGSSLFHLLHLVNPIRVMVLLELLLMGIWSVAAFSKSSKQSPIEFSEQDELLVCQTPVNRRHLVMRWFLMPWFKSAIPFWLAAIFFGFLVMELILPGGITVDSILPYLRYGFHAWLIMLPVHLACYSTHWIIGVYRLQGNKDHLCLSRVAAPITAVFFLLLLISILNPDLPILAAWKPITGLMLYPLGAGFGEGNIFIAFLFTSLIAAALLGVLYGISERFSLSRAAQETKMIDLLNSANRNGFKSYAQSLQVQQRLKFNPKPFWQSAFPGAGVLIWKDILQFKRSFHLSVLMPAVGIFSLMCSIPFLPDIVMKTIIIVIWMIQIGEVSVIRLRNDLAHWTLIRQLPIGPKKFLFAELCSTYFLSVILSIVGLVTGTILLKTTINLLVLLIPGIVAGITGMISIDILKQSRDYHLVNGLVPVNSSKGALVTIGLAVIPLVVLIMMPGTIGLVLAILISVAGGIFTFHLAVRAYKSLGM